ncbi:MAG TPA: diguanylate cyclase, partial [Burkholderiaceae bacterium]
MSAPGRPKRESLGAQRQGSPVNATRVMLVEDERIIALDMKRQLQSLGYEVPAVVASGAQAIERALAAPPDVVLMDINLEGDMDGIEAAQRIHETLPVPIIFLTAYSEDATLKRAQAALPYGYLVKPIEKRELHATIQMAAVRHRAQASVENSEQRLRLALEAASLGVWEWDESTGTVVASGRVDSIFGAGKDALREAAANLAGRVHPDDLPGAVGQLERSRASAVPVSAVFRARTNAESIRWLEVHARAYSAGFGKPARMVGVVSDITARREAEERLRQAGVVFDAISEGIFISDRARRIVSVNPAFTSLTGFSADDALGRDPNDFLYAERHDEQFYQGLADAADGQSRGETRMRRKGGDSFAAWESASSVRDARGEVTHFVTAFSDISALQSAQERLSRLAHFDQLTGLPNRALFTDRLEQVLERAVRRRGGFALLFLDLDNFKVINDTLGHAAGDFLLQTLAKRIQACLRRSDTAARLGGDEFVAILADMDQPIDASSVAQKVLDQVALPLTLGGAAISVSASAGLAVFPDDGADRHALMRAADMAMYMAKKQGRNRFCFFTQGMNRRAEERLYVEQGLRRALQRGELLIHYQPQVSLHDGELVGAEALLRWQHPKDGLISPLRFIGIAEETGLIDPLGRWVLKTACAEAAKWLAATPPNVRLSVNVSADQIVRGDFQDRVL